MHKTDVVELECVSFYLNIYVIDIILKKKQLLEWLKVGLFPVLALANLNPSSL